MRHLTIRGRVQGVGYRAFVADLALRRGLRGWARNRRDGSVEAVLAGPAEVVGEVVAMLRRGPPASRVDLIDDQAAGPDDLAQQRPGELFSVLPTL